LILPRKVDAAQELTAAAKATQDFRGWVHIIPENPPSLLSMFKPSLSGLHINTANGTMAIVANVYGALYVEFISPATHEKRTYSGFSHKLLIATLNDQTAQSAINRNAEFPLKLADFLAQIKANGEVLSSVVESTDQKLERFDLMVTDEVKKQVSLEVPTGKLTIWADPQTKLIRKLSSMVDGQPMVEDYSYGAPAIADIYDLGVPRTAQVVDDRRKVIANMPRPAVFDLPPMAQLVKDPSIDLESLEGRMEGHILREWGDFVSIECQEIKYLNHDLHEQGKLMIQARQGEMAYYGIYMLAPELVLWGGQGFPKGWPTPKLADVVAQLKSVRPIMVSADDGKNGWSSHEAVSGLGLIQITPTSMPTAYTQTNLEQFWWPSGFGKSQPALPTSQPGHRWRVRIGFGGFGTTRAQVLRDPNRPSLIVLHIDTVMPFRMGYNSNANYHTDAWYWLDPTHDDLPVETVTRTNGSATAGEKLDTTMHFVYSDFARLADGHWYPSRWQYRGMSPPTTQPVIDDGYVEYSRQIVQSEKLPAEWFGDPNRRFTDSGIHWPTTAPANKQR
jgi:hypothetical protein